MAHDRDALIVSPDANEDRLRLGADVSLENATINLMCGTITIGARTFCGHNVSLITGSHKLDASRSLADQGRDIVIGEDVWLASNCTILGPCTIGDRCVIAACACVVPGTVCEPGWIYGGVPARKIRPATDGE